MKRLLFGLAALLWGASLSAQPARDVEAVVRAAYDRIAAGDAGGAMALWSADASEGAAFHTRLAGLLRARCVEIRGLAFTRLDVTGNTASADVTASLAKWSRTGPYWREGAERVTVTLSRERDGAWRLTGWKRQEETLADALAAAKSAQERDALLLAQAELVTPALSEFLSARAIRLINELKLDEAATLARLIERIATSSGDPAGLAYARGIDSILWRRKAQWDLQEGVRTAREGVAFAEAAGDPDVLARSLLRLGRAELWGDGGGVDPMTRATALADDVEDLAAVSMAAGDLAQYWGAHLDHRNELYYATMSLELAVRSGDVVAELNAELHLAGAHRIYGDYALALPHSLRAVECAHRAHSTGSVAVEAQFELAACYLHLGDEKKYRETMAAAQREEGAPSIEADVAIHIALAEDYVRRRENLKRAAAEAEEAMRKAPSVARESQRQHAALVLGNVRLLQHRSLEAINLVHDIPLGAMIVAAAYRQLGQTQKAAAMFRSFIQGDLRIFGETFGDERRQLIGFQEHVQPYVELTEILVEEGRFAEALELSEQSKGRTLLRVLRGGRRMADEMLTPEQRAQERRLEESVTAANAALERRRTAAADRELERARQDLHEFRARLFVQYPRLKAQNPEITSVADAARMAALLPSARSAFLEYMVGENRVEIFLVRRRGDGVSVRCKVVRIPDKALASKVEAFAWSLASHDRLYRAPAQALYRLLVAPFEQELRSVDSVCIIPDGPLWQIPFEALVAPDGHFMVERMSVVYAPSITIYGEMRRRDAAPRAAGSFLAFADPLAGAHQAGRASMKLRDHELTPLPDAAREVESIAALFPEGSAKTYVGADALERRAKEESPHYSIVHFATHGTLDDRDPMFSHLVLAPRSGDPSEDGLLETWEMMQLDLHANLAVLSACETARGEVHRGEGMIGMSWALSVAGTSSTIVTQWKIASSTAADLMIDFYKQWLRLRGHAPSAKAEALRRAQLRVLADPAHRHPFYWSAFVLIGSDR